MILKSFLEVGMDLSSGTSFKIKPFYSFPLLRKLIVSVGLFAAAPNLKLGEVQSSEILSFVIVIFALIPMFQQSFTVPKQIVSLGKNYSLLFLALFILSLINLYQDFYPPSVLSLLKEPLFISLTRIIQLILVVSTFLILAYHFSTNLKDLRLLCFIYVLFGTVFAFYSIISFLTLKSGLDL